MLLSKIVMTVNELLAGERHSYNQLILYLDRAIDDINQALNSKYTVFSDLPEGASEYSLFPDRYIRSVVCIGAAWYYFSTDEEGNPSAEQYRNDYLKGIYLMTRDHFALVPPEYQEGLVLNDDGTYSDKSSISFRTPQSLEQGERGVFVDGYQIFPV